MSDHERGGEVCRRRVLGVGAGALGVLALSRVPGAAASNTLIPEPFTLGLASGDPRHESVVLWTRLAPDPLAPGAGLPGTVAVEWEIATDENMRRVVRRGVEMARVDLGHSVHAVPYGLESGREYWYRFRAGGHVSEVGRTKTLPHPASRPSGFDIAVASCQNFTTGALHGPSVSGRGLSGPGAVPG
jgi:alkaline phosphatase D